MSTAAGEVSMSLDGTKHLTIARSDLNHIATVNYIGVATKNVGGKLVALDVLVFPPAMKGAAEGHFGRDRLPGSVAVVAQGGSTNSTMTNGSVAAASERGGAKQLTVTYKGGAQMILVPPTAPVVTLHSGGVSDIKPGGGAFVNATADGGETTAGLIIVGSEGAVPPI